MRSPFPNPRLRAAAPLPRSGFLVQLDEDGDRSKLLCNHGGPARGAVSLLARPTLGWNFRGDGAVAQLGERCIRAEEARGSTPLTSISAGEHLDTNLAKIGGARRCSVGRRVPMTARVA